MMSMILPSAAPATRASPLSMTARTRERIYRPGDLVVVDVLVFRSPSSSDGESTNASKPLPLEVAVRAAGVMRVDTAWRSTALAALPPEAASSSSSSSSREMLMFSGTAAKTSATPLRMTASWRLPMELPPSFSGTAIKYAYYLEATATPREGGLAVSIRVRVYSSHASY